MWTAKKTAAQDTRVPEPKSSPPHAKAAETLRAAAAPANFDTGSLGPGLRIKGDITGTGDLQIDGSVEGTIELQGHKLTVGSAAKVNANIKAREVVVYGYVKGNVHGTARIEIKRDGSVIGDLTTAQIMIEDGADFKGSIEIDRSTAKETSAPRAASASAGSV